jgi:hypothetical protein
LPPLNSEENDVSVSCEYGAWATTLGSDRCSDASLSVCCDALPTPKNRRASPLSGATSKHDCHCVTNPLGSHDAALSAATHVEFNGHHRHCGSTLQLEQLVSVAHVPLQNPLLHAKSLPPPHVRLPPVVTDAALEARYTATLQRAMLWGGPADARSTLSSVPTAPPQSKETVDAPTKPLATQLATTTPLALTAAATLAKSTGQSDWFVALHSTPESTTAPKAVENTPRSTSHHGRASARVTAHSDSLRGDAYSA